MMEALGRVMVVMVVLFVAGLVALLIPMGVPYLLEVIN